MSAKRDLAKFTALSNTVHSQTIKIAEQGEKLEWFKNILVHFDQCLEDDKNRLEIFIQDLGEEDVRFEMITNIIALASFCAHDRRMQHDADAHSLRKDGRHGDATYDEICNFRLQDIEKNLLRVHADCSEIKDEAQYFMDRIPNEGDNE